MEESVKRTREEDTQSEMVAVFSQQQDQLPLPTGTTLSDDEIEMLQDAVGYSQEDVFQAVNHFLQRGTQWDLATFTEYMVEKGVKEAYCPHYFRAFDRDGDGTIDVREFLLGLSAMDPNSKFLQQHSGNVPLFTHQRLKMIFNVYDYKDPRGELDADEFSDLIRHMLKAQDMPHDDDTVRNEVNRIAPLIPTGEDEARQTITFEMFVSAVKAGLLPAVHNLFLLPASPVKRKRSCRVADDYGSTPIQPVAVVVADDQPYLAARMNLREAMQCSTSVAIGMPTTVDPSGATKLARNALQYLKGRGRWTHAAHPLWAGATVLELPEEDKESFAELLIALAEVAGGIMEEESRVVDVDLPGYVVGDIHGNYFELMNRLEKSLWPLGPELCAGKIVFLGDYVDRGYNGPETLAYMFAYKILCPGKWILLRGNHETREVNGDAQQVNKLLGQCVTRFGPELGQRVWQAANGAFDRMPFGAILHGRGDFQLFCSHGGICRGDLTIEDMRKIPAVFDPCVNQESPEARIVLACLWSDPCPSHQEHLLLPDGFLSVEECMQLHAAGQLDLDGRLHVRYLIYGQRAIDAFCERNAFRMCLRGHQCKIRGLELAKKGRLMTVFSDSKDHGLGASAKSGCVLIEQDSITPIVFHSDV